MNVFVVGSSVIDLFLNLDSNHCEIHDKKILLALGDKIPSEIKRLALGGNGANISVGLTRLEVPTTFYTYLGTDMLSREIEEGLSREGVELEIERQREGTSPLHIILDFDEDRIILSHYHKTEHGFSYDGNSIFDYIFLSSIADYWENAYQRILDFAKSKNIPIAFSPGTRQIENKNDLVTRVLKSSKIYFSNREEAIKILNTKYELPDTKQLLLAIKQLGPEIVSITDGENGAYAIDKAGHMYFIKPSQTKATEKTGVGDAYATGFFAAHLNNKSVQEAMLWGTLNANAVMGEVGAQNGLLTKNKINELLAQHANLRAENI